jgi:hypothetical protein
VRRLTAPFGVSLRVRFAVAVAVAAVVAVLVAACGDDGHDASPGQRDLNSVMVGSYEELPSADSEAVSAIGVELVALGPPLKQWFEPGADHAALLAQMTEAVDRIERRLTPERAPEVRTTFEPYVEAWRDLLAALDEDDADRYENAVGRLQDLDRIRVERVADVYGDDVADDLVKGEGQPSGSG